ncbi:AAA family ATPase [Geitlerinema sp. PCC 9228]|uniref:AAA family ATPase n=1 Tax=Geitlerinema sp. PCC 9228 TaxID=111611 RepID=UPI0008F9C0DD|nr:AAA family ATPase [Geitlerinema sp. PCC 9228]
MTSIDEVIQQEANPFDSVSFRPGNFWEEEQDPNETVDSIHAEAIASISDILEQIKSDRRTRTILLSGDSGSGKSYLLGRLKYLFNPQAFFAYIGPWPDSSYIWRHTLRNTVDSLMYTPHNQQESQLMLWLRSLSAFHDTGWVKKIMGERKLFIQNFKSTYPVGIYNANQFFGILYSLTSDRLYNDACDWLKGDDLDEETLKQLQVRSTIDNESAAQNILSNLGKISTRTQPIVLCFDNLDNIPKLPDGSLDLQALFSLNSMIHNEKLKNFLIIISVIKDTWRQNQHRIQPADLARIDQHIELQPIHLDQAESLWRFRLANLHAKANKRPKTPIYPFQRKHLEEKFPGGQTLPRNVLVLGRKLFQIAKTEGVDAIENHYQQIQPEPEPSGKDKDSDSQSNLVAALQLYWQEEYRKNQEKITYIRHFSAPELIQMLREVLLAVLPVKSIQEKLLEGSKYASNSISYDSLSQWGRVGIVWTEERNLSNFYHVMRACEKVLNRQGCQSLYLLRNETVGNPRNKGNQIYRRIFKDSTFHHHLVPTLESVHYLATYHNLMNAAASRELLLEDKTLNVEELQSIIVETDILENCPLLQDLQVVRQSHQPSTTATASQKNEKQESQVAAKNGNGSSPPSQPTGHGKPDVIDTEQIETFILNLVTTNQMLGFPTLIANTTEQFPHLKTWQAKKIVRRLCKDNHLQLLDPNAAEEEQLVCWIPK